VPVRLREGIQVRVGSRSVATIDELLERARTKIDRVTPEEAARAMEERGALLVDIRAESQRAADGIVPDARFIPRNVLEWRFDGSEDRPVIVMCDAGYASSLAAATLRELGIDATDLVGGFQAWRAAGLPTAA
jgi:rhodanese-related sulfurtransferase